MSIKAMSKYSAARRPRGARWNAALRVRVCAVAAGCLALVSLLEGPVLGQSRGPRGGGSGAIHEAAAAALRRQADPDEIQLPLAHGTPALGDFPALPPDPHAADRPPLPPLDSELWRHGGSYLYESEDMRLQSYGEHDGRALRLPEDWQAPEPWTWFSDFLGADPLYTAPWLKWPGPHGYMWDTRFVGYGRWTLFGFALEQNGQRQDVLGTQLELELDLRLTGTERFHVQLRPLGEDGSGGSFYQFRDPDGWVDHSTGEPQRYWFEGELHSLLGAGTFPDAPLDWNFAVGKFPFALHNTLLMNDEMLGAALGKNNLLVGKSSNLNLQLFHGFNDVDAFTDADASLSGANLFVDVRKTFLELTYAYLKHDVDASRHTHFAAFSHTRFFGPLSVAGRALFKFGDEGGRGDGQLFVVESNWARLPETAWAGIEEAVFYANAFWATPGWNSISRGNFNRLRSSFETNALVRIASGVSPDDTWGAALGAQLFRRHQDESLVPEIAIESIQGEPVWGLGIRYLRKTGSRAYLEGLVTLGLSDDPRFDREGVFVSYHILF